MGRTVAETIQALTRRHLLENRGLLFGQCVTAVGWIGGTVPQMTEEQGIVELSMADVARSLGMPSVDITDDPWLVADTVESFLEKLPAFINIRTCRNLWHAGVGTDGPPEWNRFELIKKEMKNLGLESEAKQIETETAQQVKRVWEEQLPKLSKP